MAKEFFQIRLDPELKQKLTETAQERGLTTSEAARQAFALWAGFESNFFSRLQNLASIYNTSPWRILQAAVSDAIAKSMAEEEVWGGPSKTFISLMVQSAEGVASTVDTLKAAHLRENTRERRSELEADLRAEVKISSDDEEWLASQYERETQLKEQRRETSDRRRKGENIVQSKWNSED